MPERPRIRRWTPKVKTGCSTCRARHVKCDESKPCCKNCTSLGRTCGGYRSAAVTCLPRDQPYTVGPPGVGICQLDRHMFDFFCTLSIDDISGTFDSDFWRLDIRRATQVSPAIWHAGLALASASAGMRTAPLSDVHHHADRSFKSQRYLEYSLRHQNQAIRYLMGIMRRTSGSTISTRDQEVLLLANLLFINVSNVRADVDQAAHQARQNSKLFSMWKFWEHANGPTSDGFMLNPKSLVAVMRLLDYQLVNRLVTNKAPSWLVVWHLAPCSPTPFYSAKDAYLELQPLYLSLYDEGCNLSRGRAVLPDPRPSLVHDRKLQAWKSKFDHLVKGQTDSASDDMAVLSAMYMVSQICNSMNHANRHSITTEPGDDLMVPIVGATARFVGATERLLAQLKDRKRARPDPGFSYCLLLGGILYMAMRCQPGGLRSRLTGIIREWTRNEGPWDCKALAYLNIANIHEVASFPEHLQGDRRWPFPAPAGCACVPGKSVCENHIIGCLESMRDEQQAKWLPSWWGDRLVGYLGTPGRSPHNPSRG